MIEKYFSKLSEDFHLNKKVNKMKTLDSERRGRSAQQETQKQNRWIRDPLDEENPGWPRERNLPQTPRRGLRNIIKGKGKEIGLRPRKEQSRYRQRPGRPPHKGDVEENRIIRTTSQNSQRIKMIFFNILDIILTKFLLFL